MKRKEIKRTADKRLTGFYGLAFLVSVFSILFIFGAAIAIPIAGAVLIVGPIKCGIANMYRQIAVKRYRGLDDFFDGFRSFGMAIGAQFWKLFLLFILSVVFAGAMFGVTFIPSFMGMIIAECVLAAILLLLLFFLFVVHRFTYFIIAEDDSLTELQCYTKSRKLIKGNFWKMVLFELSYLFWRIGVLLTLGVLYHRFFPKYKTSLALYYEAIKKEKGYFPTKEDSFEVKEEREFLPSNAEKVIVTKTTRTKTISSTSAADTQKITDSYSVFTPPITASAHEQSVVTDGKEDFDIDALLSSLHETTQKTTSFRTLDNFDIAAATKQKKSDQQKEKTPSKDKSVEEPADKKASNRVERETFRTPLNPYGKEPDRKKDDTEKPFYFDPYNADIPEEE